MRLLPLFVLLWITPIHGVYADVKICKHISVVDGKLDLGRNEEKLICGKYGIIGSPNKTDTNGGWDTIPLTQSEQHLRNVLSHLGYLNPEFIREGANTLKVIKGEMTKIKSFKINSPDKLPFKSKKKRKLIGYPMVTAKLNEVQDWARLETQSRGYPCATNDLQAFASSGELILNSQLNSREKFGSDLILKTTDMDPRVIQRYLAFGPQSWYDVRKMQISSTRMLSSGLFQSAFFIEQCDEDNGFDIKLESAVGKPNIFRFGVGASTEEFPFVNATYRNTNIGRKASSYTLSANYSPRLKSLNLDSELFILPGLWQTYLSPRLRFAQETEKAFEVNSARLAMDTVMAMDLSHLRLIGRVGPSLNITETLKGSGPENLTYAAIEASLELISHVYEYNVRDQNEGWQLGFFFKGQRPELGSNFGLNTYRLTLKKLWNVNGYWPPLFVLGLRAEAIAVDMNDPSTANLERIPFDDRVFLGGDNSLRGFQRLSVNNDGLGYVTSTYLGFELRLVESLPYKIQPFLIYDIAFLGRESFRFNAATLSSEGLGVRWATPFGTIRGSLAKGRMISASSSLDNYKESFVLFLSFGREF